MFPPFRRRASVVLGGAAAIERAAAVAAFGRRGAAAADWPAARARRRTAQSQASAGRSDARRPTPFPRAARLTRVYVLDARIFVAAGRMTTT